MTLTPTSLPLGGVHLIEASAGTGKTYTIANLYLRLLLGRNAPRPYGVDEILVLTFTVAATEELRHRIRQRIVTALAVLEGQADVEQDLVDLVTAGDDPDTDRRLLLAAVSLMDEASIFTIHAFCARVLSEQSFETGLLFEQNLEGDREQMLQDACRDSWRTRVLGAGPHMRAWALRTWPDPDQLMRAVRPFLFRPNIDYRPPYQVDIDLGELSTWAEDAKRLWLDLDMESYLRRFALNRRRKPFLRLEAMTEFCSDTTRIALDSELWSVYARSEVNGTVNKNQALVPPNECLDLIEQIAGSSQQVRYAETNLWHDMIRDVRERLASRKQGGGELTLDDLLGQLHAALGANPALTTLLRRRFPVAMVDEFQDTDDIQYEMFHSLYGERKESGDAATTLYLIGDPKQAIYQFRGADVFTYINARRDQTGTPLQLDTNWRSSKAVIDGINHLFAKPDIFDNDRDIPYSPSLASPRSGSLSITVDGVTPPPFRLRHLDVPDANRTQSRVLSAAAAAEDLVALLRPGRTLVDGKPLTPGQVAFLVRQGSDARAARDALAARGIRSVYVTLESVFLQDTATDLKQILEAIIEPTNAQAIRTALATRLMQATSAEIDSFNRDLTTQQATLQEFADYHHLWATRDVAPMLAELVRRRQIAAKWLDMPGGERELTNLRHLSELLQQRASQAPGMHRLIKWFAREKLDATTVAEEDRQLRLESDRNLVKIVTMHAAKGLQYDVVYIPYATFGQEGHPNPTPLFHKEVADRFHTCVDLGADRESKALSDTEALAEDMRLLYVAITRARHFCYLGLAPFRRNSRTQVDTAAGRLLALDESAVPGTMPDHLFDIAATGHPDITQVDWAEPANLLTPPRPHPTVSDNWRMHSYTGMTQRLHRAETVSAPEEDRAAALDDITESATAITDATSRTRHTFPRGASVGIALHTLMENLDFQRDADQQSDVITAELERLNLEAAWQDVTANWLNDVLQTPLGDGFALADIAPADRIAELEFHFPVHTGPALIKTLQANGFLTEANADEFGQVDGMMTGLIDLVARHNNRYYVLDYKSNHLGMSDTAYTASNIEHAMVEHLYDLQYLVYTVGLHRYLKATLDGYRYDTHVGGVKYLFMRGMNRTEGAGVFATRPPAALIESIDAVLRGPQ